MKEVVFADKDNYRSIAQQLRFAWLKNVLIQTGMNLDDCFCESDDPNDQTIENKANLRKALNDNKIVVIDNNDDSLYMYINDVLIAAWNTPHYDKREDITERDRTKRFYIGINLEYKSFLDEEVDDE